MSPLQQGSNRGAVGLDRDWLGPTATSEIFVGDKRQIAALKRSPVFLSRGEVRHLVHGLATLLRAMLQAVNDPKVGLKLVGSVFDLDKHIYTRCDDSDGDLGDFFKDQVTAAWVHFAKAYADPKKLREVYWKLVENNEYSSRDSLMEVAVDVLPEAEVRALIECAPQAYPDRGDDLARIKFMIRAGAWARGLRDTDLFEEFCLADKPQVSDYDYFNMAECRLHCDDVAGAVAWLEKVPKPCVAHQERAQELWLRVHAARGDSAQIQAILAEQFRSKPRQESFERWAAQVTDKDRDRLLAEELARMHAATTWSSDDLFFMWQIDLDEAPAHYVCQRWDQVPGYEYDWLPNLAKDFAANGQPLAASILYRALLQLLLKRGVSRAYAHGVRYLKKLDQLNKRVPDWGPMPTHHAFHAMLKKKHSRKRAFWSKYNG